MSNSNNKDVMRYAVLQTGYTEHPAGSNKTKFGKQFGMNGVPWCAEFVWASGENAKGSNPIAKSANAAGIQDLTVSQKGGSWVLKKTASNSKKKTGLSKVKFGDIVSFDFGRNNGIRQHTALCIGRDGDYYICIEGNTSSSNKGSQSNGGGVFIRYRKYTQVCSIARPRYSASPTYSPKTPYTGSVPKLPKRGYFKKGDKGSQVKALQTALNWATNAGLKVDGEFGNATLFAVIWMQVTTSLVPDGQFGQKSLAKLVAIINSKKKQSKPVATKADKLYDKMVELSYDSSVPKSFYGFPQGKPKAAYKSALDKIYPDHKKWRKEIRTGASCSVYVATTVKASGVDMNFKCDDPPKIMDYLAKSSKWKKVNEGNKPLPKDKLKPGDIIVYEKTGSNGNGHICFYKKGDYIAEANFGRCYPHRTKMPRAYTNATYIKNTYKRFAIYRIKE